MVCSHGSLYIASHLLGLISGETTIGPQSCYGCHACEKANGEYASKVSILVVLYKQPHRNLYKISFRSDSDLWSELQRASR
jgi:hypothetical protein